jgi:rubrerythrin
MGKTEKNLKEAFAAEAQAYQKYLAFADRAADEYKEGLYKLFQAVAESEKIHARRHLGHLKAVKETAGNIKEAMSGEMHEFTTLYPAMIAEAKEEQERGAEISFSHAAEVKKVHHQLFEKAMADPEHFPVQDYFVCNACGYLSEKTPPDVCPVCGAVKKGFYQVVKVTSR